MVGYGPASGAMMVIALSSGGLWLMPFRTSPVQPPPAEGESALDTALDTALAPIEQMTDSSQKQDAAIEGLSEIAAADVNPLMDNSTVEIQEDEQPAEEADDAPGTGAADEDGQPAEEADDAPGTGAADEVSSEALALWASHYLSSGIPSVAVCTFVAVLTAALWVDLLVLYLFWHCASRCWRRRLNSNTALARPHVAVALQGPPQAAETLALKTRVHELEEQLVLKDRQQTELQHRLSEAERQHACEVARLADELREARVEQETARRKSEAPRTSVGKGRSDEDLAEVMRRRRERCLEFGNEPSPCSADVLQNPLEGLDIDVLASIPSPTRSMSDTSPSRRSKEQEAAREIRTLTQKLKEAVATIDQLQAEKMAAEEPLVLPTTPTTRASSAGMSATSDVESIIALGRKRLSGCTREEVPVQKRERRFSAPAAATFLTTPATTQTASGTAAGSEEEEESPTKLPQSQGELQGAPWVSKELPRDMDLLHFLTQQPESREDAHNTLYIRRIKGTHFGEAILRLVNAHSECVDFKIKTTTPKSCKAQPSAGTLQPGEELSAQINLHLPHLPSMKQRFLVQALATGDGAGAQDWKGAQEQRMDANLDAYAAAMANDGEVWTKAADAAGVAAVSTEDTSQPENEEHQQQLVTEADEMDEASQEEDHEDLASLLQQRWICEDPTMFAIFEDEDEERRYHRRRSLIMPKLVDEVRLLSKEKQELYTGLSEMLEDYEKKALEAQGIRDVALRYVMKLEEVGADRASEIIETCLHCGQTDAPFDQDAVTSLS